MLALHARTGDRVEAPVRFDAAALPADIVWADIFNPTPEETAFIERAAGLRLPGVEELSEIETSSRLRTDVARASWAGASIPGSPTTMRTPARPTSLVARSSATSGV